LLLIVILNRLAYILFFSKKMTKKFEKLFFFLTKLPKKIHLI